MLMEKFRLTLQNCEGLVDVFIFLYLNRYDLLLAKTKPDRGFLSHLYCKVLHQITPADGQACFHAAAVGGDEKCKLSVTY